MARLKRDVPELRFHALSGQGRVFIDGRHYYCGPYDSPECKAKFRKLVAEYLLTGTGPQETHHGDKACCVADLTAEARSWVDFRYGKVSSRKSTLLSLCSLLDDEAGDVPLSKFGPRRLSVIRDTLIATGNSRKYINHQVQQIIRIFKFGISRELVTHETVFALSSLEPLAEGVTVARETEPVQPVDIEVVRKTVKFLSPPLQAMVALQVATAMRPSEICGMKPRLIDTSGDVWVYRLEKHKTARHGKILKKKAVPILGDARAALEPFMDRDPDDYCFKPEESDRWYRQQRTLNRKTPPSCGNRAKVGESRKAFKPCFDKDVYRRAIERAAKKAKVPHWFPYQIRHSVATEVRDTLGVEAAAALLGHSRTDMTEVYAKQKEAKAIEAAKAAPSLFG